MRTGSRLFNSTASLASDMLRLLILMSGLWLLHIYARIMATPALLLAWTLIMVMISAALYWRASQRRRVFLHAYVKQDSFLQGLLGGGLFMLLRQAVPAAMLSAALLLMLIRLDNIHAWFVLFGALPVWVILQALLIRMLRSHASADFLPLLARRLATALVGLGLLATLSSLALLRSYPDFADVSLERAVWHLADQEQARSTTLQYALQLTAAADGMRLWLAQQLLPVQGLSQGLRVGAWFILFALQALFVGSYLLLCEGILLISGRKS